MTFNELIKERCSVRDFKEDPIPGDILNSILEAGRLAPTARNSQPQRMYVLKSPEAVKAARELSSCAFNAPVVIMVCKDEDTSVMGSLTKVDLGLYDGAIACTHMMLQAWDLGVGSCWVCYFDPQEAKAKFELPENITPMFLLPIGYAADNYVPSPKHSDRLPLSEMVTEL